MKKMPRYDCHVHTHFSPCGDDDMTVVNIAAKAKHLELEGLCLIDHMYAHTDVEDFGRLREELGQANIPDDLNIWVGCEAEVIQPGRFSIDSHLASKMDIVVAAGYHGMGGLKRPSRNVDMEVAEFIMAMMGSVVDCPNVRIMVHPLWFWLEWQFDLQKVFKLMLDSQALAEMLAAAAEKGVAMEINPKVICAPFRELMKPFYRTCLEKGIKLAFGSDSHSIERMDIWDEFDAFAEELDTDMTDAVWLPDEQLT